MNCQRHPSSLYTTGPHYWPKLGFTECAGERQSPINVVTNRVVVTHDLPPITFRYFDQVPLSLTIANNYHSGQLRVLCRHIHLFERLYPA